MAPSRLAFAIVDLISELALDEGAPHPELSLAPETYQRAVGVLRDHFGQKLPTDESGAVIVGGLRIVPTPPGT